MSSEGHIHIHAPPTRIVELHRSRMQYCWSCRAWTLHDAVNICDAQADGPWYEPLTQYRCRTCGAKRGWGRTIPKSKRKKCKRTKRR